MLGYKTNGGGEGEGEAVATLVYFQKVEEDGAAEAASAMVMRTALGSIPPNERTASLRCCLVSEASAAASCCEERGRRPPPWKGG